MKIWFSNLFRGIMPETLSMKEIVAKYGDSKSFVPEEGYVYIKTPKSILMTIRGKNGKYQILSEKGR